MATSRPVDIPWPLSTSSAQPAQESTGRLINCHSEPLGGPVAATGGPVGGAPQVVWKRAPGLTVHAVMGQTGYRGGLIVNNLSYECFANNASTVDASGTVASLGNFPGTKKISIARNQKAVSPDVVAVDIDNGAFTLSGGGAPVQYTGTGANLPQPNSVSFLDGYLLFTIADCRIFASGINALTQNSQTFTTCQAKSSVTLLRGIAYAGQFFAFTTASCEVYQDTAQASPAFPFTRMAVLEYGLVQSNAIAGFEDGFSNLLWVAQDFGVYWMPPGSLAPEKVSSPDLDRLIAIQVRAGNQLEASCYAFSGKKFWVLSSPAWTWEFNLNTTKWSERQSFTAGLFGRWRASGGHPAFGKWLMGDTLAGNLFYSDETNYSEAGAVQLFRMESGGVANFPNRIRVPRADFNFETGAGIQVGNVIMNVTGAAAGTGGVVRLAVNSTSQVISGDVVVVANVLGTVEANGIFAANVIDATHIELPGTIFANAWISGGTVTDKTSPPNAQNPTVAVSWSNDDGNRWGNPIVRALGAQAQSRNTRVSIKNTGQSGPQARRWRIDVTDPVYVGFLGATQSPDPRDF